MKYFIIVAILLSCQRYSICQKFADFDYEDCPPIGTNTASVTTTGIKFLPSSKSKHWPDLARFKIKRKSQVIFIYNPNDNRKLLDNSRFGIERQDYDQNFQIVAKFIPDEDSGIDFEFGYMANNLQKFVAFCSVMINEDLTPQARLILRPAFETGLHYKKDYMEGDKIIVICKVLKLPINGTFEVRFPVEAKPTLEGKEYNSKQYSLILTMNIKGGNISCLVPDGYSVWTTEYLKFIDKPINLKEGSRTTLAISISVFFGLTLAVMIVLGGYTLIIKQRRDVTKQMVAHHTENAQARRTTNLTQISRMSRMSKTQVSRDEGYAD